MTRSHIILPLALLMLAGCYPAAGSERPAVNASSATDAAAEAVSGTQYEGTPADQVQFQQLFPGVSAKLLYGGIGQDVPTFQLAKIDGGVTFPAHSHSSSYYAVVVAGQFQHWEEDDADRGPIMTAGAHFYQPGGNLHYDSCIGPEPCRVAVTFPERADVTIAR